MYISDEYNSKVFQTMFSYSIALAEIPEYQTYLDNVIYRLWVWD